MLVDRAFGDLTVARGFGEEEVVGFDDSVGWCHAIEIMSVKNSLFAEKHQDDWLEELTIQG